jgi:hypothetical protein
MTGNASFGMSHWLKTTQSVPSLISMSVNVKEFEDVVIESIEVEVDGLEDLELALRKIDGMVDPAPYPAAWSITRYISLV